ncbi:arylamine N-acetyltransferase [Streptomyces sp. ISL-100]|uniref:arylamine N-acetyltransferase family protein n=1 Tax=Streptomyces sp. ISL-100 TaxID=2819173 RepID=UPI001BE96517|nr:arylamine N-acetyltransferase [Streptomyces sp. ISL-100]MBT2396837.1 arylamine N-acetyltransferase [Streptomyces sp. ISL-100]
MTWSGEEVDLDAYLVRIGYEGDVSPTIGTLRALHRAHVASIPFENLDVALGRPVRLDPKSVQAKLAGPPRGGYCYEQNSLFAAVLERLGFRVAGRGARNRTRGAALPPVTHAMLVVEVDGEQWLADTGFGDQGPLEPVPLRDGAVVEQGGWTFGICVEDEGVHVLRSLRPEGWVDLYAFAPQTLFPSDFTVMNHYSSSHPLSKFVEQVVVQRTGPGERHALVRDELTTVRTDGSTSRRRVATEHLGLVLAELFGIEPGADDVAQLGALTGESL